MPRSKKPSTKKDASEKKVSRRGVGLQPRAKRPTMAEINAAALEPIAYFKAISVDAIANVPAHVWASFLQHLAETGVVGASCKASGLNRITAYARRKQDTEFREAWEEAHQIGMSCLEDEAKRRAYEGVLKGVYYKGDRVDEEVVYSDQLLMFLMQGRDARYKRKQEITGADGSPLLGVIAKLDDDGLEEMIQQKLRELKDTPDA